jgi:hypothetical protein
VRENLAKKNSWFFHFTSSGRGPESARQNLAVSGSDDKAILIWGFG